MSSHGPQKLTRRRTDRICACVIYIERVITHASTLICVGVLLCESDNQCNDYNLANSDSRVGPNLRLSSLPFCSLYYDSDCRFSFIVVRNVYIATGAG